MGREAICTCDWGGTVAEVKALLETSEIICAVEIRKRVAFKELKRCEGPERDRLHFKVATKRCSSILGSRQLRSGLQPLRARRPRSQKSLGLRRRVSCASLALFPTKRFRRRLAEAARIATKDAD
jgi:hypothetical protein